jgi:hypothetical protein
MTQEPPTADAEMVEAINRQHARETGNAAEPKPPYGEWCRNPKLCAGKGYCPRDPNCGD